VIRAKIRATRRDNKAKVAAKSFSRPKTLKRDIKKNIGNAVIQAFRRLPDGPTMPIIGEDGIFIGMTWFGASAPYKDVYNYFKFTPEAVAQAAMRRCNS
jgi:transketolase